MSEFDIEVLTIGYHETAESFREFLESQPDIKYHVCKVTECLTTSEASKLISRDWFNSELLKKFPTIFAIRIEIDEKLNLKQARQPNVHEFEKSSRILIAYESTIESKKVVYWKNRNSQEFHGIELGLNGESMIVADFVVDFIIEALFVNRSVTQTSSQFHLTNLLDSFKTNLLIKSILDQNLRVFRELIKLPFDINHGAFVGNARVKTSAADIAYEQHDHVVLFELLCENSMFPTAFKDDEIESNAIKAIVKLTNELHEAIKNDNKEKVIEILQQNSNLRHFYDISNVSAVATALKSKNIEIYKVLIDHDVSIGPLEDFRGILKKFVPKEMRAEIRDLNSKVAKCLDDRHLITIFAKSVIAYDNQSKKNFTKLVKKALKNLNEIPIGRDLLQLSAHNEKLKIHFDFNQSSILRMDPVNGAPGTSGMFYSQNSHVYIAAKDAEDEVGLKNLMAVLSHELCHLAINLVFRNGVDPYAVDDEEHKNQFLSIINKCKELKDEEKIVKWVYELYPENEWPAELIVRVPHMLVFYFDDPIKCRELRKTFSELFKYFDKFVAPQMMKTIVLLDKIARKSFSVNCAVLTDPLKNAIYESTIEFQGQEIEFSEIVDRNSEVFNFLKHSQMREILNCTEILKIGKAPEMNENFIERNFIDFEVETEKDENGNGWSQNVMNNLLNFKKIAMAGRSNGLIILSDHAGTGKSSVLRNLSAKLNSKYTDHWVAYIELKNYLEIYEKFSSNFRQIESKSKNEQKQQIVKILKEILNLTDELEFAIFTSLFDSNQVILLMDGFDEICPNFKEFFLNFIQIIRNLTKNQIWLTTRPQYMKELKQKFKQRPFKMLPFDDKQKKEFLKINSKESKGLESENILKFITKNFVNLDNLQLSKILTEINSKISLLTTNLFTIIELIIESHKKILIKKNNEISNFERDPQEKINIWQIFQIYSFKLLFKDQFEDFLEPQNFIKLSELSLFKKYQNSKQKWTSDAIARYGFLYIDDYGLPCEIPHFIHPIFAEFFVAKFLIENIFEADDDDVGYEHMVKRMKLLVFIVENEKQGMKNVMGFVRNYFERKLKDAELNRFCSNFQKSRKNSEIFKFLETKKMQTFVSESSERKQFWEDIFGKL
ncbi:hypothetical protein PVAND_015665 [Polypedilum vanderplanki]|uniref:NACHT domain-containing protein n=1 Tax=Polypedilum vanderplanki TaxID=319348 RepID=A0A9J6BD76_POLVA|nr:hypothetical protein PVAND_015665 [Polypedilum vanderplanki]